MNKKVISIRERQLSFLFNLTHGNFANNFACIAFPQKLLVVVEGSSIKVPLSANADKILVVGRRETQIYPKVQSNVA